MFIRRVNSFIVLYVTPVAGIYHWEKRWLVSRNGISSELSLGLLEVLDGLKAGITGVLNYLLWLPVSCDDGAVANTDSWHLEGEEIDIGLNSCLSHGVVSSVEDAAILEEATRESAKNDDLILSDLNDASTLSFSKLDLRHINDDPWVGSVLRVVALDWVTILFARLGDSAEDKDESVVVGTAGMVVSSDVEVWDLEPKI